MITINQPEPQNVTESIRLIEESVNTYDGFGTYRVGRLEVQINPHWYVKDGQLICPPIPEEQT